MAFRRVFKLDNVYKPGETNHALSTRWLFGPGRGLGLGGRLNRYRIYEITH